MNGQAAHAGHLPVPTQVALQKVAVVFLVARRRRRDHGRVVAVFDIGTRLPIGPVRREVRLAAHQLAENRARAAGREVSVLEPSGDVEPQVQVIRHLAVDVAAKVVLVVPRRAVAVIAVLGLAPQREIVAEAVGAAPQRHMPDILLRHRFDHRGEPIGVGVHPGIRVIAVLLDLVRRIARRLMAVRVDLVEHRHVRRRVRHTGKAGGLVEALVEARRQIRPVAAPALRRNQDDAVGRPRTEDRGHGIFQDADALDVARVEPLQATDAVRHAVDHNERIVVVQRVIAANADRCAVVSGLPTAVDRHHTGQPAGERIRQVDRRHALQFLPFDGADSAREP